VRLYLPEEERDSAVVICSELPANEGSSITHSAGRLAAEVIRYHKLPTPLVWIEHYPPEATDGHSETFELVDFASYEVKEKAPYMGEVRLTLGEANWKELDREIVKTLVGGECR
jgi:ABC-type microcin C transport system permease subunit YejE